MWSQACAENKAVVTVRRINSALTKIVPILQVHTITRNLRRWNVFSILSFLESNVQFPFLSRGRGRRVCGYVVYQFTFICAVLPFYKTERFAVYVSILARRTLKNIFLRWKIIFTSGCFVLFKIYTFLAVADFSDVYSIFCAAFWFKTPYSSP